LQNSKKELQGQTRPVLQRGQRGLHGLHSLAAQKILIRFLSGAHQALVQDLGPSYKRSKVIRQWSAHRGENQTTNKQRHIRVFPARVPA
jgi:hypothetical protein